MKNDKLYTFHIAPLTEADARAVCAWHYEGEYAVYNIPGWHTVVAQRWGIADEALRSQEFYSLRNDADAIAGFFRLREQGESVWISLGLAPEYCGHGLGKQAMELILKEARHKAPGKRPELEVRAFNQRAIACYTHAGFVETDKYEKSTPMGSDIFVRMALLP